MSADLYDVLEIPENANDIWIKRAYDLKLKQLAKDTALSDDDLEKRRFAIEKAYNVLSNPSARERYDRRHEEPEKASPVASIAKLPMRLQFWIGGAIALVIAGGAFWSHQGDLQEQREAARRIADAANAKAAAAVAAAADEEKRLRSETMVIQLRAEHSDKEAQREAIKRQQEWNQLQQETAAANLHAELDARRRAEADHLRQVAAQNARVDEENQRRKAQAEVERQARWLQEQERRRR